MVSINLRAIKNKKKKIKEKKKGGNESKASLQWPSFTLVSRESWQSFTSNGSVHDKVGMSGWNVG